MKELVGWTLLSHLLYRNCSKDDRRVEQRPLHMGMSLPEHSHPGCPSRDRQWQLVTVSRKSKPRRLEENASVGPRSLLGQAELVREAPGEKQEECVVPEPLLLNGDPLGQLPVGRRQEPRDCYGWPKGPPARSLVHGSSAEIRSWGHRDH